MFRNLKAIEIAEAALLADVAAIFQFIAAFLPIGVSLFYLLNFVVFAILVLRRGMYVGIMGLCVAMFVITILIGPHHVITLLLEGMGGIFLGMTMKLRFHHIPILILGIISGSLTAYFGLLALSGLAGIPLDTYARDLHRSYNVAMPLIASIVMRLGLGSWWQHSAYPVISSISTLAFTYWLITFYLVICLFLSPVVFCVYVATNVFVRMLGYDVRPLLEGKPGRFLRHISRRLLKIGLKRGIIRKSEARV